MRKAKWVLLLVAPLALVACETTDDATGTPPAGCTPKPSEQQSDECTALPPK